MFKSICSPEILSPTRRASPRRESISGRIGRHRPSVAALIVSLLLRRMNSARRTRLFAQASRAAKRSKVVSETGRRLAKASTERSDAACAFVGAAQQARRDGKLLRSWCCRLYARWLLLRSRWLLGRSMLLLNRVRNEYKTHQRAVETLKNEN
jgi:hypothetical protein